VTRLTAKDAKNAKKIKKLCVLCALWVQELKVGLGQQQAKGSKGLAWGSMSLFDTSSVFG
jgi:hypothetical protein